MYYKNTDRLKWFINHNIISKKFHPWEKKMPGGFSRLQLRLILANFVITHRVASQRRGAKFNLRGQSVCPAVC